MIYTRQELIEKIKSGDPRTFQEMVENHGWRSPSKQPNDINKFEKLWELNMGDGNDWSVAIRFIDEDITILLEGVYSSEGDSEFNEVSYGVPFEFKETRYRAATAAEIRDMKIDQILK
jgi:hypothetical protein